MERTIIVGLVLILLIALTRSQSNKEPTHLWKYVRDWKKSISTNSTKYKISTPRDTKLVKIDDTATKYPNKLQRHGNVVTHRSNEWITKPSSHSQVWQPMKLFMQSFSISYFLQSMDKLQHFLKLGSIFRDKMQSRGEIGFPSLEAALLSLAFLTVAVSLISVIQDLLGLLKPNTSTSSNNNAMNMGSMGTGGAQAVLRRSSRISPVSDTLFNLILSAIRA